MCLLEENHDQSGLPTQTIHGKFVELAFKVLDEQTNSLRPATKKQLLNSTRLFAELAGDISIHDLTQEYVAEFIEKLSRLPARREGSGAQSTNVRALPCGNARYSKTYAQKTIQQHVSYLASVWGMLAGANPGIMLSCNPFKSQKLSKVPSNERHALSQRQVEKIFKLSIFTSGIRPKGGDGEACYWIPLLLLWTAARPSEIAELTVADVLLDPASPGACLRFRNSRGRKRPITTPKVSRETFRLIPIHSRLLSLGFLDYVEWIKYEGNQALFPELVAKGTRNDLFARFGLWWSGYLEHSGVYPVARRPAKGFRTHWLVVARKCDLKSEAIDYIMGRDDCFKTGHSAIDSATLFSEMQKLNFEGYNLANIGKWASPDQEPCCVKVARRIPAAR